jgi:hypothetical protein
VTHIVEKLQVIPWLAVEFVTSAIFALFYLSTSIDLIVKCFNR